MEQASNKHGSIVDDEMKAETRGLEQADRGTRAEEWRDPEPSGEDQPDTDRVPHGTFTGGTPDGMTEDDVARRSRLASTLDRSTWPANRQRLIEDARSNQAPDWVLDELSRLPDGKEFANVQDVWATLGHGVEEHRF